MKKETGIFILSLAGGSVAGLAWMPWFPGPVIFIAFVPFFLLASVTQPGHIVYGNRLLFIKIIPGFIIFNAIAIGWTRIAGVPLLLAAVTANSFLMAFAFWLGWLAGTGNGRQYAPVTIIIAWMAMEYATNHFWLFSPWLNLGNGLARNTYLVQWYEFQGVAGGSLWVLTVNALIAAAVSGISSGLKKGLLMIPASAAILLVIIPAILAPMLLSRETGGAAGKTSVLVIQPNFDPHTEKFTIPFTEQLETVISLAQRSGSGTPDWIITPETTIDDPIIISEPGTDRYIGRITGYLSAAPATSFLLGATTNSDTSKPILHNSALQITSEGLKSVYHKSKLVPGIERPFGRSVKFMQRLFPYLGGTGAGFYPQSGNPAMTHQAGGTALAPVICFESAFPEHVADFVKNGAGIIAVITNDGWWQGTKGYQQHFSFSPLRAIETRRPVVRAANTGISAIINHRGETVSQLKWWNQGFIAGEVTVPGRVTFFVRHGNIIGRASATALIFLLIIRFAAVPLRKWTEQKKF